VPAVIAIALVVVAPIAAGWAAVTNSSDASVVGLMLTVTGVSTVFPRFDGPHALASMLFTVPGLAMAADLGQWGPWIGALAWALAAIGIAARSSLTPSRVVRRDLPGLRRLPVLPMSGNVWPDETDGLPVKVFVFRLDAALVYACGGVSNPTPFDYPASTTFGAHGQADVVDAFESGMPVCHGWTNTGDPLTPSEILAGLPTEGGTPIRLGRVLRAGDEPGI
jgi:hypothetical protein